MVLVPAAMTLMGKANWWLPAWLEQLMPSVSLEGGRLPEADDEVDLVPGRVAG